VATIRTTTNKVTTSESDADKTPKRSWTTRSSKGKEPFRLPSDILMDADTAANDKKVERAWNRPDLTEDQNKRRHANDNNLLSSKQQNELQQEIEVKRQEVKLKKLQLKEQEKIERQENKKRDESTFAKNKFEIKGLIDKLYSGTSVSDEKVATFIENSLEDCDKASIASLMRLSGMKTQNTLNIHLPAIATKIEALSTSSSQWTYTQIASVIYGLQDVKKNEAGVKEIILIMTKNLSSTMNNTTTPTTQNISMLLMGLENVETEQKEDVRKMFFLISLLVTKCPDMSSQGLSEILFNFQSMNCDTEVRQVLKALLPSLINCKDDFSAENISNSLIGLKSMNSDRTEVRGILSALANKVEDCGDRFDAQDIGDSLYSLQGMSSDSYEVCSLLSALVSKVETCEERFSGLIIGNILHGLQNMNSEYPEVRSMLSSLVPKVRSCTEILSGETIGIAIGGLQGMSSDHPEVRAMLSALVPLIYRLKDRDEMSVQSVSSALYGMQGMNSSRFFMSFSHTFSAGSMC
jgi:hypothetical protein